MKMQSYDKDEKCFGFFKLERESSKGDGIIFTQQKCDYTKLSSSKISSAFLKETGNWVEFLQQKKKVYLTKWSVSVNH